MRRVLLLLFGSFLLLTFVTSTLSAQHADRPIARSPLAACGVTVCTATPPPTAVPPTAVPPSPQPQGSGNPAPNNDHDGDGTPDTIDQCPDQGGPSWNHGCPATTILPVTTVVPPIVLPNLPTSKTVCALATRTTEPVNLRSQPSLYAPIIGVIDPQTLYYPDSSLLTLDGSIWYALNQPFGWVAGIAVRVSAGCPYVLPAYKMRPISDQNPLPLSYVNGPHIVLDKGDGSGEDTPLGDGSPGYCAPSFALDATAADGSQQTVHFRFGDGSVLPTPERGCISLNSNGHDFVIEPPPDPDGSSFPTPWSVGFLNNELTFIVFLQPNPGSQPPGPPTKPGVTLAWSLVPPGPPIKPGALNFVMDWSRIPPGPPDKPGFAIEWSPNVDGSTQATGIHVGPSPGGPGGTGAQGLAINWGLIDPPDPDKQPFSIDFFPNGFDPSVGGFTQIENQPGGSSPGDKFGFTQIENQPLGGAAAIQIEIPAVQ